MNKKKLRKTEPKINSSSFDVVFGFDMETDIGSYTPYYNGVQLGTPLLLDVSDKTKK